MSSPSSGSSRGLCGCCSGDRSGDSPRRRCLAHTVRCCTHCGYPQHKLCCFGCNSTTRVVFIGAGGTLMGFWYFMLLSVIIICAGTRYVRHDPMVITILVLGLLYLPMGLILIFSAQMRNPLLLRPWIICNCVLAVVDFILTVVHAVKADPPAFCTEHNFKMALAFLEICIKVAWCYCIAIVTQYRHKLLAAKAARRQEVRQGLNTY